MLILADAALPDFSTMLLAYGPLGGIAALVFYYVVWYGPRLVESHIAFTNLCRDTHAQQQKYNESVSKSLETLTFSAESHLTECKKTQRMVKHLAEAGKEATNCPDVIRHLDRALDEQSRT